MRYKNAIIYYFFLLILSFNQISFARIGIQSISSAYDGYNYFGSGLGVSGTDLMVGIPQMRGSNGLVYVYSYNGENWELIQNLGSPVSYSDGAKFGIDISMSGNYALIEAYFAKTTIIYKKNLDKWEEFQQVNGALINNNSISNEFAVFKMSDHLELFKLNQTQWDSIETYPLGDYSIHDNFLIIGYPNSLGGTVNLYKFSGTDWLLEKSIVEDSGYTEFGKTVNITDEFVAIESDSGIHIYTYENNDWVENQIIKPELDFGKWAINNSYLVLGSSQNGTYFYYSNPILLYKNNNGSFQFESKFYPYDDDEIPYQSGLGSELTISQDFIVISEPFGMSSKKGRVWVLDLSTPIPESPILHSPQNEDEIFINAHLQWQTSEYVDLYNVQLTSDINFDTNVQDVLVRTSSYIFSNLNPGTKYYWRVRSQNYLNKSEWSEIRSFTTKTIGPINILEGNLKGFWPSQFSPYIINGDVWIQNNDTLIIEAGSQINIMGDFSLKLKDNGMLIADGSESEKIMFTTSDSLKFPGAWEGIIFLDDPEGTYDTKFWTKGILNYCIVEYAKTGIATESFAANFSNCIIRNCNNGIVFNGDEVSSYGKIQNSVIENNLGFGIIIYAKSGDFDGSSNPLIIENIIQNNNLGGIKIYANGIAPSSWTSGTSRRAECEPIIQNNIISSNNGYAIYGISTGDQSEGSFSKITAYGYTEPEIKFNTIVNNLKGITTNATGISQWSENEIAFSEFDIDHCTFWSNNDTDIVALGNAVINIKNSILHEYSTQKIDPANEPIININYCALNMDANGIGNIPATPFFIDSLNNDYHLTFDSPCIDVGDPNSEKDPDNTRTDIGAFYYHQSISSFSLLSPVHEIVLHNLNPKFNWSVPSTSGGEKITYDLFCSSSDSFITERTIIQTNIQDSTFQFDDNLSDSTTYFWKIKAKNPWGLEKFSSETWSFTINTDTTSTFVDNSKIVTPTEFKLYHNYPNPFNPETNIKLSLPETIEISVDIYNINGQRIINIYNGVMEKGFHNLKWDATDLSSGIYFIKLNSKSFKQIIKCSIIK